MPNIKNFVRWSRETKNGVELVEGIDLEGMATEQYVDDAIAAIEPDLTGYATEEYVDTQIAASGSGEVWEQILNNTGNNLTGLTSVAGTWASNGTIIQQTDGTSGTKFLRINEPLMHGTAVLLEAEFRVPTAGQAGGSNESAGFLFGSASDAATSAAPIIGLRWDSGAADRVYWERNASALITAATVPDVPRDAWHKLRVLKTDPEAYTVWLNNAPIGMVPISPLGYGFCGLASQWSLKTDWRNIKAWRLGPSDLPA